MSTPLGSLSTTELSAGSAGECRLKIFEYGFRRLHPHSPSQQVLHKTLLEKGESSSLLLADFDVVLAYMNDAQDLVLFGPRWNGNCDVLDG